jgi:hypothetical protein
LSVAAVMQMSVEWDVTPFGKGDRVLGPHLLRTAVAVRACVRACVCVCVCVLCVCKHTKHTHVVACTHMLR